MITDRFDYWKRRAMEEGEPHLWAKVHQLAHELGIPPHGMDDHPRRFISPHLKKISDLRMVHSVDKTPVHAPPHGWYDEVHQQTHLVTVSCAHCGYDYFRCRWMDYLGYSSNPRERGWEVFERGLLLIQPFTIQYKLPEGEGPVVPHRHVRRVRNPWRIRRHRRIEDKIIYTDPPSDEEESTE